VALFAYRDYCVGVYTTVGAMPLNIRGEDVNQLAEKLAARRQMNKAAAVKLAVEHRLRRLDEAPPLRERLGRCRIA
jgi:hypothetical protein